MTSVEIVTRVYNLVDVGSVTEPVVYMDITVFIFDFCVVLKYS